MGRAYKTHQVKIISSKKASKQVEESCLPYIANVRDVEIDAPSIGSIMVVSKSGEVFPNFLCMSSDRDIDFCIDLEPSARPISTYRYCIAPEEFRELKDQIKEVLI